MTTKKLSPAMIACIKDLVGGFGLQVSWTLSTIRALETREMIKDMGMIGGTRKWWISDDARAAVGAPLNVVAPVKTIVVRVDGDVLVPQAFRVISNHPTTHLPQAGDLGTFVSKTEAGALDLLAKSVGFDHWGALCASTLSNPHDWTARRDIFDHNQATFLVEPAPVQALPPDVVVIKIPGPGGPSSRWPFIKANQSGYYHEYFQPLALDMTAATRAECLNGLQCRFHATEGDLTRPCSAVHSILETHTNPGPSLEDIKRLVVRTPVELAMVTIDGVISLDAVIPVKLPVEDKTPDLDWGPIQIRRGAVMVIDDPQASPLDGRQRRAVTRWWENILARREYPPPMFGYGASVDLVPLTKDVIDHFSRWGCDGYLRRGGGRAWTWSVGPTWIVVKVPGGPD